jgi:hypothetical protein
LHMLSPTSNAGELLDFADASLYASRRTTRGSVAGWPRHRRKAMIGAAAAAAIGFGFSSAYVAYIFQPSSDQAVIGAPAPSGGGHAKIARVGGKPVRPAAGGSDLPPAGRGRRGDSSKTAGSQIGGSKAAHSGSNGTGGSNSEGGSKPRVLRATPSGVLVVATVTPTVGLHPKPTLVSITEPRPKPKPKLVSVPEPKPKLTSKPAAPPWPRPPTWDRGHGGCGESRGGPPGPRRGWPHNPWQRRSPTWPRWFRNGISH